MPRIPVFAAVSMVLEIRDDGTPLEMARNGICKRLDAHAVRCKPLHRLDLDLEDGADVAVIETPHPVSVEGGNGPDRYIAAATDAPASAWTSTSRMATAAPATTTASAATSSP